MTTNQIAFATLIVGSLSLLVGWLVYRLTKKGGVSKVRVDWITPYRIEIINKQNNSQTLYSLIEGLFTNTGSKTVTMVSLKGEGRRFVRTERMIIGERITQHAYKPTPHIFILPEPINHYCSKSTLPKVLHGTEVYEDYARLNIPIPPGHSKTLSLCIMFDDYKKETRKGMNTVIGFYCDFNNNQSVDFRTLLDGTIISEKIQIEKRSELKKG